MRAVKVVGGWPPKNVRRHAIDFVAVCVYARYKKMM
jgi:hypothetical protein